MNEDELLSKIKSLVASGKYRIRIHSVRHMVEEGFTERDLITAIVGKSRMLEDYADENRCLIVGYFRLSEKIRCPLHVVCDYSHADAIDIVTSYIPEKPWWDTPTKRGRIK